MPEYRKDPVVDRWVIIAAERSKRPQPPRTTTDLPRSEPCPFCSGNESMTPPEILAYRDPSTPANSPGWRVRVVPNKYPAVVAIGELSRQTKDLYESLNGIGAHEVVIEAPVHCAHMPELDESQFEEVLRMYRDRIVDLQKDNRWRHVLIYKNEGGSAGATLTHVHSQLIALPMVPREVDNEWQALKQYHTTNHRCIYCDIIEQERDARCRLVSDSDGLVVCCPYAPRFPFETWILPEKHSPFFESLSDIELACLARSLRETLCRLSAALGHLSFNYVIHSAPFRDLQGEHYHWHLEIMPKTTEVAGFEWGSGYYINTVTPEHAARSLRAAKSNPLA